MSKKKREEKKEVSFLLIFKYIWAQARKHRWWLLAPVVVVAIDAVIAGSIIPVLYRDVVDIVSGSTTDSDALFAAKRTIGLIALWYGINFVFRRAEAYIAAHAVTLTVKDLQDSAMAATMRHSRKFFTNTPSGKLVARLGRYGRAFDTLYEIFRWNIWWPLVQFIAIIAIVFPQSSTLGWVFIGWMIFFIGISVVFAKIKKPYNERSARANSKKTGVLADILSNIIPVKIFSAHTREESSFGRATEEERHADRSSWFVSAHMSGVQALLLVAFEVGGMLFVVSRWAEGVVSVGFLVLTQIYIQRVGFSVFGLARSVIRASDALVGAQEMVEIMEEAPGVLDPERPERARMGSGEIAFSDVSFMYDDADHEVLHNFSLEIPSGQSVGLVGKSGSGKSTITNLLLRFMDVTDGSITIDGQDIRNVRQDDLRRHISYVPQEPILFHRTLAENIKYGKPRATNKEMYAAAKAAHADEFIDELPKGYKTLVGERGVKLSGGQRQRIAIARVMLEDAPILILDEATSALDSVSEKLIQKAFKRAMKNRTTIVIAHRLSTVKDLGRIIVLDKGRVVEDGSHKQLLAKKGYYHNLWQHQADYEG